MIRVGIIGLGVMGRHHLRLYSAMPGVQVIGISDIDQNVLQELANKYRVPTFTNYQDLLKEKPQAVSITVPTHLHADVALEALRAGAHVLVEKPLAHTVEEGVSMIEAAAKANRVLMVGHVERFNPIISAIRQSIQGETVIMINITRVGPFPPRIKDVGVIVDLAVHDIDLVRYLTNSEVEKVLSLTSRQHLGQHEEAALISLMMKNGVLAHITTSWLTPFKVREIEVATRQKFIKGWFMEQKALEYSRYTEDRSFLVKELIVPFAEPLRLELEAFIHSIQAGQSPPVTGWDGLQALKIAYAALAASHQVLS